MDQSSRGVPDGIEGGDQDNQPVSGNTTTTVTTNATTNTPADNQQQQQTSTWEPNSLFLETLTAMGFPTTLVKKALFYTKNDSVESAVEWILSNSETDTGDLPLELQQSSSTTTSTDTQQHTGTSNDTDSELYKMVFVVNGELSMGIGKIAAQVAHAALGLHRILLQHQSKYGESLLNWSEYGETKIVLRGETTKHLLELEYRALKLNLPCYMVHDAGKTQVKSGSTTVFAVFGNNNLVDQVTGQLKLY